MDSEMFLGRVQGRQIAPQTLEFALPTEEITYCARGILSCRAMRHHARDLDRSDHHGKDHKESTFLVGSSPAWHKGKHSIAIVDELGEDLAPHRLVDPRQFGGKRGQ